MHRSPPLLRAAVAALLTSVSCSEAQDPWHPAGYPEPAHIPWPSMPKDARSAALCHSVYDRTPASRLT